MSDGGRRSTMESSNPGNLSAASLPSDIWHEITQYAKCSDYSIPIVAYTYEHQENCTGSCKGHLAIHLSRMFRDWYYAESIDGVIMPDGKSKFEIRWIGGGGSTRLWYRQSGHLSLTIGGNGETFRFEQYSTIPLGQYLPLTCDCAATMHVKEAIAECAVQFDAKIQALRKFDFVYPKP